MKETLLTKLQREAREKFESLKCVNGAMYFGTVEATCPCGKTRCSNEQTQEEAEAEYKVFLNTLIANTLKQVSEEIGVMIENESQSFGDKNGRKVCWSCYEDGYCSHKIKIEALTDAQKLIRGELDIKYGKRMSVGKL